MWAAEVLYRLLAHLGYVRAILSDTTYGLSKQVCCGQYFQTSVMQLYLLPNGSYHLLVYSENH